MKGKAPYKAYHAATREAMKRLLETGELLSSYDSVNDWLLFHGTTQERARQIFDGDFRYVQNVECVLNMYPLPRPPKKRSVWGRSSSRKTPFKMAEFQQIAAGCMFSTKFRRSL